MDRRAIRLLMLGLLAAIGLAAGTPARAQGFAPGSTCHAAVDTDAAPGRWNCTGRGWSIAKRYAVLRFDLRGKDFTPTVLVTRLTRFRAMRLTVVGADGSEASRDVTEGAMTPATGDWMMSAALPRLGSPVTAVILRVEGARHTGLLADAAVRPAMLASPETLRNELLIAALCGMLLMPLLFNFAFFRVLRERFLLWHALSTGLMLAHTLVTSGLINRFVSLSLGQLSVVSSLTVGGGIIAAALFSADLIEAGKLDPVHRRMLRATALWVPPWTLFYLVAGGPLTPYAAPLYLASFLVPMSLFIWAMVVARRRGSRAVNYQILAWAPVMITALIRIVSALGATDAPIEMLVGQHYAMGLEVLFTLLGVFDRLMAIRRERDLALADLRVFEDRAERDPLTGLLNRRGLEKRFQTLRAEGYSAIAVIDLDKFKSVNDTYGHMTGDAVLCAVAEALEPDVDTLAIRMGGEEFLLLLRGQDLVNRAERRRQAIATRVAGKVPGLDRVVTASMGLVELPVEGMMRADFKTLYGQCDRLLYEAKNTGRNRTMREKMQSFGVSRAPRAA